MSKFTPFAAPLMMKDPNLAENMPLVMILGLVSRGHNAFDRSGSRESQDRPKWFQVSCSSADQDEFNRPSKVDRLLQLTCGGY
jgi:hypothetical protein